MFSLDKFTYAILYMVIFAGAVFVFFMLLGNTETLNTEVNRDTLHKSSVVEHTDGVDKEALAIDTVTDNYGNVQYVSVKGSDIVYDIISIINTLSDTQIRAGKINATIKVKNGFINLSPEEMLAIKNKKSSYLNGLNTKIDKDSDYKRIYYYNTDLDINELKYDL